MGKLQDKSPTSKSKPSVQDGSSSMPLSKGLAETAWRVAVPFLVFSLGGIWLDDKLQSSPVFTLIGLVLALAGVGIVVRRFVNKNYPETFEKKDKTK